MNTYWLDFFTLFTINLLGLISPGPDFIITVKQSLSSGRLAGYYTALGITAGISVHITYCILGLGLIISQSILALNVLKYAGAIYLIYLGVKALRSKAEVATEIRAVQSQTPVQAFRTGLLTNLLNPKATLFILSLFTVVVKPHTSIATQFSYGLMMATSTMLWFTLVSTVLTIKPIREQFQRFKHWIDRTMGVALIALGIKIVTSK